MNFKKKASSNPGEEKQLFHPESEKVVEIGLERLRPFKNHPFFLPLIMSIFRKQKREQPVWQSLRIFLKRGKSAWINFIRML